jgi:hypothetical protein
MYRRTRKYDAQRLEAMRLGKDRARMERPAPDYPATLPDLRMRITLERQVAEARRELGMRRRVYPRFVASDKLTQDQADDRIAIQEAIVATLEGLRKAEKSKTAPELF